MTARHIGEKAHTQSERLYKKTDQFNRNQDKQQPSRHTRWNQALEIAEETIVDNTSTEHDKKRADGQARRHIYVARSRCAVGNKPEEIARQDEEKDRK